MKLLLQMVSVFFLAVVSCFAQIKEPVVIYDVGNMICDPYLGSTIVYVDILKENPKAKGRVVIYEGKVFKGLYSKGSEEFVVDKYVNPRFGLADILIKTIRKRLRRLGLKADEVVFVKGGFREKLSIELWIIPAGTTPPPLSPTVPMISYERSKPSGYCLSI